MKIEIIDDPSRRGRGGYVEYEGTKINSWTKATIHLPPADTTPQTERLAILLHEFGHIAGIYIGTVAQVNDIRLAGGRFIIVDHHTVIDAEKEAWDLADKMYTNLKVRSQNSYGIKREY
jgi:hypothetical protein